jgi:hypothetical protein
MSAAEMRLIPLVSTEAKSICDPKAIAERIELVRRIGPLDVEGGIGLGIALACASLSTSAKLRPVSSMVERM